MALNITLELSDDDLAYFARVMQATWRKNAKRPEQELIDGARRLIKQARKVKAPQFVMQRLEDIELLIDLLNDHEWELEPEDRRRITAAVGYFAIQKDMISDKIPGIGYLDDAIVAELVLRELKHDLEGYRDFDKYRDNAAELRGKQVTREEWLAGKRKIVMDRVRRRREQMFMHGRGRGEELTHPILRFKA